MFVQTSYIKMKLKGLSLKIFNKLENNNDCNFDTNGEKVFIDNLLHLFKNWGEIAVFDIGANIEEYSKMIETKSLELNIDINLHLFEPTKDCFTVISEKFSSSNIKLNNFGVSNKNVAATIYYDKEESGLASLYQRNLDSYGLKLEQNEEIILKLLDEYIEEQHIRHINFIKIDIEGHELKAFEGSGKCLNDHFIDFIQFEYGGANLDSHTSLMEIYEFLTDRGFKIAKIVPTGLEIREYKPFMENFQYSNYAAISKRVLEVL